MSKYSLSGLTLCSALLSISGASAQTTAESRLHVSVKGQGTRCVETAPCTLDAAREKVRQLAGKMSGDIHVVLAGGEYILGRTLTLSGIDSGQNGFQVIYEGAEGAEVRLSGGQRITGWRTEGKGVMQAPAPRDLAFRQLYIAGQRAVRARWPNEGFLRDNLLWNEAAMNVSFDTPLPKGIDWAGAEFVANRHWQQHRIAIDRAPVVDAKGRATLDFSADGAFISFNAPGGTICQKKFPESCSRQPYYFENSRGFLDKPGEWFLDERRRVLHYMPQQGQKLDDVRVPVLQTIVRLQGTDAAPVHDVTFRNITFEYAGWTDPSRVGVAPVQATWLSTLDGARYLPAAVEVRGNGARNIRFEQTRFRHLGATGLAVFKTASDIAIVKSRFEDISAGAISIHSDPDRTDYAAPGSKNIEIIDNVISHTGVEYTGSVGIFAGYVQDTRIEHNEIHDLPYTAISVGWGWTDKDNGSKNNSISYNHIFRAMLVHDDGGGIYTLSKQPGTMIVGNYIHDLVRNPVAGEWGVGAVYLDNGSEGITVRDNAIERVDERIHLNLNNIPGQQVPAKNNSITDYAGPVAPIASAAGPRTK